MIRAFRAMNVTPYQFAYLWRDFKSFDCFFYKYSIPFDMPLSGINVIQNRCGALHLVALQMHE
jgi:hypothetical protein